MPSKFTSQAERSAEAPGGRAKPSAQDTALHNSSLKARLRRPQSRRQGDGVALPLLSGPCIPPRSPPPHSGFRFRAQECLRCIHVHSIMFANKPLISPPNLDAQFPLLRTLVPSPPLGGVLRPQDLYINKTCSWQHSQTGNAAQVPRTSIAGALPLREYSLWASEPPCPKSVSPTGQLAT